MAVDDIETYCESGTWKTRWRAVAAAHIDQLLVHGDLDGLGGPGEFRCIDELRALDSWGDRGRRRAL
jgi:hypothetical protein